MSNSLLKISPNFVLQLLLLLFKPPASDPADDSLPLPEELSLCALGDAHIGLPLAEITEILISVLYVCVSYPPGPIPVSPNSPLPEADVTAARIDSLSLLSAAARESTY